MNHSSYGPARSDFAIPDLESLIAQMETSRIGAANLARQLAALESERILLRVAIYDRIRATGKTQKDSDDAARTDPEYLALHQARIAKTEYERELHLAASEAARLRAQLGIVQLGLQYPKH